MSRPPTLALPDAARAYPLHTARGPFAVLDAGAPRHGTALLVPGFTGSKEDFIALLAPLADAGWRVVAVDGRGQYESEGPRDVAAYARAELVADLLAQAEAVAEAGGGGPLHLVGHSFGGLVARSAVLLDPVPWASLTLMSSGPAAITPEQRERTGLLVDALRRMDVTPPPHRQGGFSLNPEGSHDGQALTAAEADQQRTTPDAFLSPAEAGESNARSVMESVWRAMRAMDPQDLADSPRGAELDGVEEFLHRRWLATVPEQLVATGGQLVSEPDRVAELAAVELPKLVVSGETDYAWPTPSLDEMAARLGARREVIAGAGHSPNAECPKATAAVLDDFWRCLGGNGNDR